MSDSYRHVKEEAAAIEQQSWKEQGTHAAYLRGYAAGLIAGARRLRQDVDYRDLVTSMLE